MKADLPPGEQERLEALRSHNILDTAPEQSYDDITLLASQICDAPISAVSFIDQDRQWFKSIVGLYAQETSRDVAFCAHAILNQDEPMIVEDAQLDPRFADNELVLGDPNIRFYAGTPLVTAGGMALGTLCVIDRTPRKLSDGQRQALVVLGRQVVFQLQLRQVLQELQETIVELKSAEAEVARTHREQDEIKSQFFSHVSHELRSPLTSIYQFVTILLDGLAGDLSDEQRDHLGTVLQNAEQLKHMISDLLEVSRAHTGKLSVKRSRFRIEDVIDDVTESQQIRATEKSITLSAAVVEDLADVVGDACRVRQILTNLIENAIKFTPEEGQIEVQVAMAESDPGSVCISVEDSGCGLEPADAGRIFDYLYQVSNARALSREGLGLGLYICKQLVERQGGRIWVEAKSGAGSRFCFTIPTFDLTQLLRPVLKPENIAHGALALIGVNLYPGAPAELRTSVDVRELVHGVLEACADPSKDVVLPGMGDGEFTESIYVIAMADAAGAEILTKRIDEQLEANEVLTVAGYAWKIGTTILSVSPGDGANPAEVAAAVAAAIDPHLNTSKRRKAA